MKVSIFQVVTILMLLPTSSYGKSLNERLLDIEDMPFYEVSDIMESFSEYEETLVNKVRSRVLARAHKNIKNFDNVQEILAFLLTYKAVFFDNIFNVAKEVDEKIDELLALDRYIYRERPLWYHDFTQGLRHLYAASYVTQTILEKEPLIKNILSDLENHLAWEHKNINLDIKKTLEPVFRTTLPNPHPTDLGILYLLAYFLEDHRFHETFDETYQMALKKLQKSDRKFVKSKNGFLEELKKQIRESGRFNNKQSNNFYWHTPKKPAGKADIMGNPYITSLLKIIDYLKKHS